MPFFTAETSECLRRGNPYRQNKGRRSIARKQKGFSCLIGQSERRPCLMQAAAVSQAARLFRFASDCAERISQKPPSDCHSLRFQACEYPNGLSAPKQKNLPALQDAGRRDSGFFTKLPRNFTASELTKLFKAGRQVGARLGMAGAPFKGKLQQDGCNNRGDDDRQHHRS